LIAGKFMDLGFIAPRAGNSTQRDETHFTYR
jgi:hypothetical protein